MKGDYPQAQAALEESVTAFRAAGDTSGVGASLRDLGGNASLLGDYATAEAHLESSLALLREVGDSWSLANTLAHLGDLARLLGNYPKARRLFGESLDLVQKTGFRNGIAFALFDLSCLARADGDYGEAERLLGDAVALVRDDPGWALGAGYWRASFCELYGVLAVAMGSLARGARLLGAADRHGSRMRNSPAYVADRAGALATAQQALGEAAFAAAWDEGEAMSLEEAVEYALDDGGA